MSEIATLFSVISLFWFFSVAKTILFWIYFWQLKEYHIGRFLAHFSTAKGKKLTKDPLTGIKLFLGLLFFAVDQVKFLFPVIIFSFYFGLTLLFLKKIFSRQIKIPVITKKTSVLISLGFLTLFLYPIIVYWFFQGSNIELAVLFLLLFDIFAPGVASLIVLGNQPLTGLAKRTILRKARQKIEKNIKLITIGITGSFGKSSTKEILSAILEQDFNVLKTPKNKNSEIGISQTILKDLTKSHQVFVCEMGAYNKGGIKLLTDIANPKIGILTGINEQHLATFGSQENIIKAKYELIQNLPPNGLAIFNGENKHCLNLYKKTKEPDKLLYSSTETVDNQKADIWAENVKVRRDSLAFTAKTKKGDKIKLEINLLGKQNIPNILGAILCAKELGMEKEKIKKGIESIQNHQGASKLIKRRGKVDIIDSSYSSNPKGVLASLDHLKLWKGKRIVVMPCLIELGKSSKRVHRQIGKKIAKTCDKAYITTKDRLKEIKEGAAKEGMEEENIIFSNNSHKISQRLKKIKTNDSVVLLEGRVPKKILDLLTN